MVIILNEYYKMVGNNLHLILKSGNGKWLDLPSIRVMVNDEGFLTAGSSNVDKLGMVSVSAISVNPKDDRFYINIAGDGCLIMLDLFRDIEIASIKKLYEAAMSEIVYLKRENIYFNLMAKIEDCYNMRYDFKDWRNRTHFDYRFPDGKEATGRIIGLRSGVKGLEVRVLDERSEEEYWDVITSENFLSPRRIAQVAFKFLGEFCGDIELRSILNNW